MAQHLFLDLAAVVRQHAANVQKVGAKIESLVQGYSKTGPNVRQLKVWLGKLRKAYAAGLIDPPSRGRPRENEFVTVAVQQAYSVKDLEGEASYLVKVLSRAQDRDSWQAAFDVTDMHVRGARVSLERIAERLEEAAQDLMPERFRFGKFTVVDRYGLSQRRVQPWFEAITRASRLLEQKGVGYLLYGDLVLTSSNDWGGLYNPTGDIVSLDLAGGSVGTKRLTEVLVHELGHRLWFKFLDGGARDRFASPWISRDEATRRVWEQYRDVFTMPPDEPREAFELVWKTKYDFKAFQQWIRESPAKLARWMRFANNLYTGPEPAHTVIRNNKLNREAFDHARQKVERWSEQSDDIDVREGNAQSLERFRVRQERVWREVKSYRSSMLSYQEVEDMLEPHGSEFHVNPRAKKGGVLRKLLEIKPVDFSVTRYGNMNRREDFAEIFTEVLMGRVKDRAVQQRLQAVLPQGRVLSVTAALAPGDLANRKTVNIQQEYDGWNRKVWGGDLPRIPVKWSRSKTLGGRVVTRGLKHDPSTWEVKLLEVSDFTESTYEEFLGILLHEMIHVHVMSRGQMDRGQHGPYFNAERSRVEKLVPFKVPLSEDITHKKVSEDVKVKPVGVVLFATQKAIQVYDDKAMPQVMQDIGELPQYWLERHPIEFYLVEDRELAKYPAKRKFNKRKVSYFPIDDEQVARVRRGRKLGSLPVAAAVGLTPRKNQDPRAQAFWRFVDRAAAQVDGWPDWMLHREQVAAEDAPAMPFEVGIDDITLVPPQVAALVEAKHIDLADSLMGLVK